MPVLFAGPKKTSVFTIMSYILKKIGIYISFWSREKLTLKIFAARIM